VIKASWTRAMCAASAAIGSKPDQRLEQMGCRRRNRTGCAI
jgi:hypothetical protein